MQTVILNVCNEWEIKLSSRYSCICVNYIVSKNYTSNKLCLSCMHIYTVTLPLTQTRTHFEKTRKSGCRINSLVAEYVWFLLFRVCA